MPAPTLITQHTRLVYTSKALAEAVGVSESQVRAWANGGLLPRRYGADGIRGLFFSQAEVEALISGLVAQAEDAMRRSGAA